MEERRGELPRDVWVLGAVSLLMDSSSELIHALLPLFLVSALGVSPLAVGALEGAAEATALFVKVFSGALSDRLRRRKPLILVGYGLAAASKPLFPLARGLPEVVAARLTDRLGKGLRGAPRDALIADVTPPESLGAAYGLRQALDTVGAVVGPLLGMGLMVVFAGDFRRAFWAAVVPAWLAVALLAFGIHEPAVHKGAPKPRLDWSAAGRLGRGYWRAAAAGAVFALARFSEAFLILRARERGLGAAAAPAALAVMNVVYAAAAYPAGRLGDRVGQRSLLAAGVVVLALADILLAAARGAPLVLAGAALWGLHMGLTQGAFSALVAARTPADLRGTGFGLYNLACGAALLAASALAGLLWERFGPPATFAAGASLALATLAFLPPADKRP